MAPQASQLYSRNITSFLLTMLKNGGLTLDLKDELIRGPLVIHGGEVVHQPTKLALEQRRI
jgi:NAD/NADP transhydrogenase alpha subunit